MSDIYPYSDRINLFVEGKISKDDALRQNATAREILNRFAAQPGIILADEVGMGKTFVSLAVAISVALADPEERPVIIMVPPSLRNKWPRDFDLFLEKCVSKEIRDKIKRPLGTVTKAVDFLKLLDDPPDRRKSIVFVTHGAMSRGLNDGWVKYALIYKALYDRRGTANLRKAISRFAGKLLYMGWVSKNGDDVWLKLLSTHPDKWLEVLHRYGVDPEGDNNPDTDDDPVPQALYNVLWSLNTDNVYKAVKNVPHVESKNFNENLHDARREINKEVRNLWKECVKQLRFKLPLLILDEAHHLKNAKTQLASLFQVQDAKDDADEISHGPLQGVFERMLFLTATPFQLGHHELCSVLERFSGIDWESRHRLSYGREEFLKKVQVLRNELDAAQESAVRLDKTWGKLCCEDLVINNKVYSDIEEWWGAVQKTDKVHSRVKNVVERFNEAKLRMAVVEQDLQKLVVRHIKAKQLSSPHTDIKRRRYFHGKSIAEEGAFDEEVEGLEIKDSALLPFLLAARASAYNPYSRPVFAEGLASSYEAFLHTSKKDKHVFDDDEKAIEYEKLDKTANWYLDKMEHILSSTDIGMSKLHPKIDATVNCALRLWKRGEKVLVFCHYIATGRALRQHISDVLQKEIICIGSEKLGCKKEDVLEKLEDLGDRFFKIDSPLRKACDRETFRIIEKHKGLRVHRKDLIQIVRRYFRTPSFLVRFFPLGGEKYNEESVKQAFKSKDASELSLEDILDRFLTFLVERCGSSERVAFINALNRIQTGSHVGADVNRTFGEDEIQGDTSGRLIANVRLVNGQANQETRQKLLLTFNTPFYPEVLIASSVMAEGVDLQLNCRYVIHHDLSWNPSSLEQRNGRVDRIGAKAEYCYKPICIYMPFVAETQDEKMYRVVMDRERWFKVLMGEKFKVDYKSTENLAKRIPLPQSVAEELAFKLGVC